jgi:hypothetical protein
VTPLADSAARLTEAFGQPVVHGAEGPGWTRCADVDAGFVTRWEHDVAAEHVREYGRSHPSAAAGYVLGWYAGIPAGLGGALFRLDRRVPRLHRSAVAFRLAPEAYPEASALLDGRFWCLPDDPGAGHPDATVVADEAALAAVLRAEVRGHADAFLATYPAHGRLPRRALLGAFTDGIDTGLWLGGDPAPDRLPAEAALVLPAGSSPLLASTIAVLVDGRGRRHVDRRTLSCCYYFKVDPAAGPCGTCPRITAAERLRQLTELPDETPGA